MHHHARLRLGGNATLSVTGNGQCGGGTIMIFGFRCRWSILLTFTDLMAVANVAFQRSPRFWKNQINTEQPQ